MNLFPLIPVLVPIASAVLVRTLSGFEKKSADEQMALGIYEQSKGVKIFLWCGGLIFFCAPFLFELRGVQLTVMDWCVSVVIDAFILICCIYTERNVVYLKHASFVFRGFLTVEIKYGDVASFCRKRTAKGNRYFIIESRGGRKVRISGYINGFSDLVERLTKKIEEKKS